MCVCVRCCYKLLLFSGAYRAQVLCYVCAHIFGLARPPPTFAQFIHSCCRSSGTAAEAADGHCIDWWAPFVRCIPPDGDAAEQMSVYAQISSKWARFAFHPERKSVYPSDYTARPILICLCHSLLCVLLCIRWANALSKCVSADLLRPSTNHSARIKRLILFVLFSLHFQKHIAHSSCSKTIIPGCRRLRTERYASPLSVSSGFSNRDCFRRCWVSSDAHYVNWRQASLLLRFAIKNFMTRCHVHFDYHRPFLCAERLYSRAGMSRDWLFVSGQGDSQSGAGRELSCINTQ